MKWKSRKQLDERKPQVYAMKFILLSKISWIQICLLFFFFQKPHHSGELFNIMWILTSKLQDSFFMSFRNIVCVFPLGNKIIFHPKELNNS